MSLFSRKNSIINELIYLGTLPNFSKVSSQKLRSIVNSSCASSGQTTRTFADKKQHDAGEFLSSKKDANQNLGITWRLGLFYWRLWTFYFCLDSPPLWAFPLFVTFFWNASLTSWCVRFKKELSIYFCKWKLRVHTIWV